MRVRRAPLPPPLLTALARRVEQCVVGASVDWQSSDDFGVNVAEKTQHWKKGDGAAKLSRPSRAGQEPARNALIDTSRSATGASGPA